MVGFQTYFVMLHVNIHLPANKVAEALFRDRSRAHLGTLDTAKVSVVTVVFQALLGVTVRRRDSKTGDIHWHCHSYGLGIDFTCCLNTCSKSRSSSIARLFDSSNVV